MKYLILLFVMVTVSIGRAGTMDAPTGIFLDGADFYDDGFQSNIAAQIRWTDNATAETSYQIEISTNNSTFYLYANLAANAGGFDNARVPWTSNRWFRVRALNATTQSPYSDVIMVTGLMPPTHIDGATTATNRMTMTWEMVGGILDGYMVQQDTTTNFAGGGLVEYTTSDPEAESLEITNAFVLNTVYYFRVLSTHGTNRSVGINKPRAYVAVAPNGPPIAPTFYGPETLANSTSVRAGFLNNALNQTGYKVEHSIDSNTWTQIPYIADGLVITHDSLTPGTTNFYRVSATNTLGSSPYAHGQIRIPQTPAVAWTSNIWYVSRSATAGNNTGTNWANAWVEMKNFNWGLLGAGSIVYVDGGASGLTYNDTFDAWTGGTSNAPLVIRVSRESGHNGIVTQRGGIVTRVPWVTFDGSRSDTFSVTPLMNITNNIGWKIWQTGEDDGGFGACFNGYSYIGIVAKWLECTGTGNNLASDTICAVNLDPSYEGPYQCEFAYSWIHDNWGSGLNSGVVATNSGPSLIRVHHNVIERNKNNQVGFQRSADVYNNIIRESGNPSVAHPDGYQGGITDIRFYNNIFGNCYGSIFYVNLADGVYSNFYMFNNFFYSDQTNEDSSLSIQFSWIGSTSATISNMVIAGNTFYSRKAGAFSTGSASYPRTYLNCMWYNNLWYSGDLSRNDSAQFGTGGANVTMSETNCPFDFNAICGPSKLLGYRSNGVDTLFASNEAVNAIGLYTHNTSAIPSVLNVTNLQFNLLGLDSVAKGHGTNLSFLSAQIPAITNDLNGFPRGTSWDIGAYQVDRSVVLWLFDGPITNGFRFPDLSGNSRDAIANTNENPVLADDYFTPQVVSANNGLWGVNFRAHGSNAYATLYGSNPLWEAGGEYPGYGIGDHVAVTNMAGFIYHTNETWMTDVCFTNGGDAGATIFAAGNVNTDGSFCWGRFLSGNEATEFYSFTGVGVNHHLNWGPTFPNREQTNVWINMAVTFDADANQILGYSNGVLIASNTMDRPYFRIAQNESSGVDPYLGIGGDSHGGTFPIERVSGDVYWNNGWLNGYLRKFKVWNRVLTSEQVLAEASGGSIGSGVEPGTGETPPPAPSSRIANANRVNAGRISAP